MADTRTIVTREETSGPDYRPIKREITVTEPAPSFEQEQIVRRTKDEPQRRLHWLWWSLAMFIAAEAGFLIFYALAVSQ